MAWFQLADKRREPLGAGKAAAEHGVGRRLWLGIDALVLLHGRPVDPARAIAAALLALVVVASMWPAAFAVDAGIPADGHAVASLDIAVARAVCGERHSVIGTLFSPSAYLRDHPDDVHAPLREILRRHVDVGAYCGSTRVTLNNENGLMLIETAWLRAVPPLSLAGLGLALHATRVFGLVLVAAALVRLGAGIFVAGAALAWGVAILKWLEGAAYSSYSFLFLLVVIPAVAYAVVIDARWLASGRRRLATAVIAGVLTAFAMSVRTAYGPVLIVFFVVTAAAALAGDSQGSRRRTVRTALATCAVFTCGLVLGTAGMYAWLNGSAATQGNSSYHTFGAPLVLGLALPRNPLSEREGIVWDDAVAWRIARQIDAAVPYQGLSYDSTLSGYYASLWWRFPRQMLGIYRAKAHIAGGDIVPALTAASDPRVMNLLAPVGWVHDGLQLMAIEMLSLIITAGLYLKSRKPLWLALGLLSVASLAVHAETIAVMPYFFLPYHNYSVFYLGFLCIVVAAAAGTFAVDATAATGGYVWRRRAAIAELADRVGSWLRPYAAWTLREGVQFRGRRPLVQAIASAAAALALIAWLVPAALAPSRRPPVDSRSRLDLDTAIGAAMCGTRSASTAVGVSQYLSAHPELTIVDVRSLLAMIAGSVDRYCVSLRGPAVRDDAVSWFEATALRLRPRLSVAGIAKGLKWITIGAALMLMLLLARLGCGVACTAAIAVAALYLLGGGWDGTISVQRLSAAALIAAIASYGLALTATPRVARAAATVATFAGIAICLGTLTVAVVYAVAGLFLLAAFWWLAARRRRGYGLTSNIAHRCPSS